MVPMVVVVVIDAVLIGVENMQWLVVTVIAVVAAVVVGVVVVV